MLELLLKVLRCAPNNAACVIGSQCVVRAFVARAKCLLLFTGADAKCQRLAQAHCPGEPSPFSIVGLGNVEPCTLLTSGPMQLT